MSGDEEIVDRYLLAIDEEGARRGKVPHPLVEEFMRVAHRFSDRFNISYGAWIDVGVPDDVLTLAGIVDRIATPAYR